MTQNDALLLRVVHSVSPTKRLYRLLLTGAIIALVLVSQSMRMRPTLWLGDESTGWMLPRPSTVHNTSATVAATSMEDKQTKVVFTKPERPPRPPPFLLSTRSLWETGHWDHVAASLARAYPDRTPSHSCTLRRLERSAPDQPYLFQDPVQGIFYNKVPKAASSTLAGINQRIAIHVGRRLYGSSGRNATTTTGTRVTVAAAAAAAANTVCTHREHHLVGAGRFYGNRLRQQSFLWGSIRDPADRALSRVYFHQISQGGFPDDDDTILAALKQSYNPQSGTVSKGKGGFQLAYLTLDPPLPDWFAWHRKNQTVVKHPTVLHELVWNVTHQYDFIAVTERMEESVVALQLVLGLRMGDVLSASSAKVGGGYYYQAKKNRCVPIQKTQRSPAVQTYLQSDKWYAVNYGDYILYAAANQSLDLTIDRLGRDRFNHALRQYRNAQRIVAEECEAETFPPCSANGTVQVHLAVSNCYARDAGCGYPCIGRIVRERGW